ncbi:hypothetical protein JCM3766R1_006837 [Sporobolomyces carnicolor]
MALTVSAVFFASQSDENSSTDRKWLLLVAAGAAVAILLFALFATTTKQPNSSPYTTEASSTASSAMRTATGASGGTSRPAQDFFESLASTYSMTPAKVATLPAPSTAIPDPTRAAEYMGSNWPVSNAKASEFVEFVDDPLSHDDNEPDIALSVMYPKGQYTQGEDGGASLSLDVFGQGKTRAMISYEVGFETNFDFVKGGKLPGLFGGSGTCSGGRDSESCFSARFMWRAEGAGEGATKKLSAPLYTYIPLYDGQCDESVTCHGDFGQSYNRGSFKFSAGQYTTLTEIAILNSDPSRDGTEANGYLAVYDGETLAFERSDLVWRTNATVFFSKVMAQTFFGGSTADYASTALTHTFYKNWQFYEGDEASTMEGESVVASVGT